MTCSGGKEVVPLFVAVVVAVSKLISLFLDFYLVTVCRILPIINCSGNINLYFYQKYIAITTIYGFNIIDSVLRQQPLVVWTICVPGLWTSNTLLILCIGA